MVQEKLYAIGDLAYKDPHQPNLRPVLLVDPHTIRSIDTQLLQAVKTLRTRHRHLRRCNFIASILNLFKFIIILIRLQQLKHRDKQHDEHDNM
jgi:hypothetical protein